MARTIFQSERVRSAQEKSLVTLYAEGRFTFNAYFGRLAELQKYRYVIYRIDEPIREICFEFLEESERNKYSAKPHRLENQGGSGKFRCAAGTLIKNIPWIRSVAQDKNIENRKFEAVKDGNLWCIRLMPSFEERVERSNYVLIPTDACGIYRYLGEDDEVLYIGMGTIRDRLQSPERKDWIFTRIEYSIIADAKERARWEAYWIEKYKDTHGGRLPYYNRQSGNNV